MNRSKRLFILILIVAAANFAKCNIELFNDPNFKYRILVDKVYSADNGGKLQDEDYKKIAELGFNIVTPRFFGNDPAFIEENAKMAQKHGLYYMGWLRGSLPADPDRRKGIYGSYITDANMSFGEPVKYILESGHEFDLLSLNSEELWEILTSYIMNYVKLSKDLPIIGTFLDFEIYARPLPQEWSGHLFAISYDSKIIEEFAKAKGITLPSLEPSERAVYLQLNNLKDAFVDFQVKSWQERMKKLRSEIDAVNPKFQIACYPSYYTLFVQEAVWKELSTEVAPVLACEHYTYVRGFPKKDKEKEYWRISNQLGVELNVDFLKNQTNMYRSLNVPFKVLGGIDPISLGGEDPMFQAMSMVAISQIADGYWIFYEGVTNKTPQSDAFEVWFKLANEAIATGSFDLKIKTDK